MSDMAISFEAVGSGGFQRGTPRLSVKGRRRKAVNHLLKALQTMMRQDAAEERRAETLGYSPYLLQDRPTIKGAVTGLITRCQEVLSARG